MKKLLLMSLLIFTVSCQPSDEWKTYTIKKGNHSSGVHGRIAPKTLRFKAVFDNSAKYNIGKDQSDINKLYGFSEGLNHQKNSARFGWRWLNDRIEIVTYVYVNGERLREKVITSVKTFEENDYFLMAQGDKYIFRVNEVEVETERGGYEEGYYLFPYFGGSVKAPHDVTIKIKE